MFVHFINVILVTAPLFCRLLLRAVDRSFSVYRARQNPFFISPIPRISSRTPRREFQFELTFLNMTCESINFTLTGAKADFIARVCPGRLSGTDGKWTHNIILSPLWWGLTVQKCFRVFYRLPVIACQLWMCHDMSAFTFQLQCLTRGKRPSKSKMWKSFINLASFLPWESIRTFDFVRGVQALVLNL